MGKHGPKVTVLVVDDQPEVADAYASQLSRRYTTRVAYTGEEALEKLDEGVDVILLDRQMPGLSGDDVLDEVRQWGLGCRIIMVSAVDPELEIVDMPFDEYVCKPVSADELFEAVERQLRATDFDDRVPEFIELTSKLRVLEDQRPKHELSEADEVVEMRERASRLSADIRDVVRNYDSPVVDPEEYC